MNGKMISLVARVKGDSAEPAIKVGSIITVITGIFGAINVIAPDLISDNNELYILAAAAFVLPIITAVFTRGRVWSPSSVKDLLTDAIMAANEELDKLKNENEMLRQTLTLKKPSGIVKPNAEGGN